MVSDTKSMSPDEYSHYVLQYSAIQSGFVRYNSINPPRSPSYDESIASALQLSMKVLSDTLMDNLASFSEEKRAKVLDFYIEQVNRHDFALSKASD